jgi:predicted N-acyltransferase/GNAT superfamily N-acetyltransferase
VSVRVVRSVEEVAPEAWDELCDDPVFSHGWFRALEESRAVAAEPRHLLLEQDGRVAAILPCFVQRGDPYYDLADRLLGAARRFAERLGLRALPALLAYSPLAQRSAVFVRAGVDRPAALAALAGAMADVCREEGLAVDGWLFADARDAELERALDAAGHRAAFLAPAAAWRNEFARFEDWVEHFRSVGRRRHRAIRHELNRAAKSGVEYAEAPLATVDDETLWSLHASFYARHNGVATSLEPAFFGALKRGLGERAVVHTARRDGELLAYSIVLKGAGRWHMFLTGERDADAGHADAAHFALDYHVPIRRAIEQRAAELHYGLSSYEEKLLRGCRLTPLALRLRGHTPLARLALALWLPVVDRHYRRKHRRFPVSARSTVPVTARGGLRRAPLWRRWLNVVWERHVFVITAAWAERQAAHVPPADDLRLRRLSEGELDALDATTTRSGREMYRVFRRGDYVAFGAFAGERLVGYAWITAGERHYSPYFGWQPLRDGESFIGFTWADPDLRGRGISRQLKAHAARTLGERGIRVQYAAVHEHNTDSLKTNARGGGVPVRLWHYTRLGPFARRRSSEVPDAHPVAQLFAHERARAGWPPREPEAPPAPLDPAPARDSRDDAQWTPGDSRWRQLRGYLRRHGPAALAAELARRALALAWERLDVVEMTLELDAPRPLPSSPARGPVEVRRLAPGELHLVERIASPAMRRQFRRFAAEGFECWGAFVDGELVGYNWYTGRDYSSEPMATRFPVAAGEVFLAFAHTVRAWRRRGIDHAIRSAAFADFARRGALRLRLVVDAADAGTLRLNLRWGARPCRLHRLRRLFGWRRASAEPIEPTPELIDRLLAPAPRLRDGLSTSGSAR